MTDIVRITASVVAAKAALIDPDRAVEIVADVEREVGKVIVGQRALVREVMVCLLAEGHVLLEGVPGLGKTTLARCLSAALDVSNSRIQFTPDLLPADIVGTQLLDEDEGGRRRFRFRPGPVFANLVLADEVNRTTPKTQSALLEAMAERTVTVGGETHLLPRPFLVLATQNPIELEGTYPLPEAQLDRFLLKAVVGLPSADELVTVLERTTASDDAVIVPVVGPGELASLVATTRAVPAAGHVLRHAADLVLATHADHPTAPPLVRRHVRHGASPRGAQALILASKAAALIEGRPNASVEDVRHMAMAGLRHRIVLGFEAQSDGTTADDVVRDVLAAIIPPGTISG